MNGEWGCYLILNEFLNNANESKLAAGGWGGDRFVLYESGKTDEVFVAQLSSWDTPLDAKEFFDAYAKRTANRYPEAKQSESTNGKTEWKTSTGRVVMELRGSRVAILEGIPAKSKN